MSALCLHLPPLQLYRPTLPSPHPLPSVGLLNVDIFSVAGIGFSLGFLKSQKARLLAARQHSVLFVGIGPSFSLQTLPLLLSVLPFPSHREQRHNFDGLTAESSFRALLVAFC